jgi:hypothetical protein
VSRGQKCTICTDTNRGQIEALIMAGVKLKDIAQQLPGLSKFALSRHRRNCLVSDVVEPTSASLESQVNTWMARCEELYVAGAATLDLRSQASAIQQGFRCLEASRKAQERAQAAQEEKEVANGADAHLTIAALDALIANYDADPRNAPIEHIRYELHRANEKLFPFLCSAVLTFIREFRPPEAPRAEPAPAPTRASQPAREPSKETASA